MQHLIVQYQNTAATVKQQLLQQQLVQCERGEHSTLSNATSTSAISK